MGPERTPQGARRQGRLSPADATADVLDDRPVRRVAVSSAGEGDDDGAVVVWLTEDADRVPVRTSIRTRAGWVEAKLMERRLDPAP